MSNDVVIFSSWVPPHLFHRGEQYLRYLKEYFGDCDIYCGVNWGSDPRWLDLLENYKREGLQIEYKCVAPSMFSTSDNAGYQAALSLYKLSNKPYDMAYFTHTKSITHPDKNHREGVEHMVVSFHKNRQRVKRVLNSNHYYGGWSAVGRINYEYTGLNKVDEFYPFLYPSFEQTFVLTSFVIKNDIINTFIHQCQSKFFTQPFETMGYNRYFFEFYFPSIISKFGFIPLVDEFWDSPSPKHAREEMKINFNKWKEKTGLSYLQYPDTFEGMKPW